MEILWLFACFSGTSMQHDNEVELGSSSAYLSQMSGPMTRTDDDDDDDIIQGKGQDIQGKGAKGKGQPHPGQEQPHPGQDGLQGKGNHTQGRDRSRSRQARVIRPVIDPVGQRAVEASQGQPPQALIIHQIADGQSPLQYLAQLAARALEACRDSDDDIHSHVATQGSQDRDSDDGSSSCRIIEVIEDALGQPDMDSQPDR